MFIERTWVACWLVQVAVTRKHIMLECCTHKNHEGPFPYCWPFVRRGHLCFVDKTVGNSRLWSFVSPNRHRHCTLSCHASDDKNTTMTALGLQLTLHWRHNGHDGVSNYQPHHCLLNRLFGRRSKKISTLPVTDLCAGNSPTTGEFPTEMASNAEIISIWCHHEF